MDIDKYLKDLLIHVATKVVTDIIEGKLEEQEEQENEKFSIFSNIGSEREEPRSADN